MTLTIHARLCGRKDVKQSHKHDSGSQERYMGEIHQKIAKHVQGLMSTGREIWQSNAKSKVPAPPNMCNNSIAPTLHATYHKLNMRCVFRFWNVKLFVAKLFTRPEIIQMSRAIRRSTCVLPSGCWIVCLTFDIVQSSVPQCGKILNARSLGEWNGWMTLVIGPPYDRVSKNAYWNYLPLGFHMCGNMFVFEFWVVSPWRFLSWHCHKAEMYSRTHETRLLSAPCFDFAKCRWISQWRAIILARSRTRFIKALHNGPVVHTAQ